MDERLLDSQGFWNKCEVLLQKLCKPPSHSEASSLLAVAIHRMVKETRIFETVVRCIM